MVAEATPDSLIIRSAALFGPWDVRNVVTRTLLALSAGTPCWLPQDVVVSPTYVPDLVHTALNLLIDRAAGTWHVVTPGAISWFDFVRRAAACSGVSTDALRPCEQSDLQAPAERPRYGVLTSTRGIPMPPLDDALERYGRWFHRRFVDLASVCP
jgi:dTDP-4-dehydrorhamnose reductase